MVETGGSNYPVRAWSEELSDLRGQMRILRAVAKRYIWSYSGRPMWYPPSDALVQQYKLAKQDFNGAAEAVPGWHEILREKKTTTDPRLVRLVGEVRKFDRGRLNAVELCDRFATPGRLAYPGALGESLHQSRVLRAERIA